MASSVGASVVVPESSPDVPGIRAAARQALGDLYYHSIRFVPANLAWGVAFLAMLGIGITLAPVLGVAVAPVLAFPLVAICRLAGLVVRGRDAVLADAWGAVLERPGRTLVAGILIVGITAILATNVVAALVDASPMALALGVLAGWGLVVLWLLALPFWVLLADPDRADRSLIDTARLTAGLLLVRPFRMLGLALAVTAILVVSSVLMAALLTVGVAYAALMTARVVLPAADQLASTPDPMSSPE